MKSKIKILIRYFFKIFYKQLDPEYEFPIKRLFLYFFFQKIIGINRKVPWPVHHTSFIKAHDKIKQQNVFPGDYPGNYMDGRNGIIFGTNVWIGPYVSVISQDHDLTDYKKYTDTDPIRIGDNSLLLNGCTILPGVQLAEHTVVAAGAVVSKSFTEPDILIGGVPAKIIKKLPPYKGVKGVKK